MRQNKLKVWSGFFLAATVFILTQTILTASAKAETTADVLPPSDLSSWFAPGDALAFFNFGRNRTDELAPASCAAPPSSLVSWYRGENNANDANGINNGTLQNGATFAAGRVGQSFSFDGVDDFVLLPNNPSLDSPAITVESWINPQPFATVNGGFIYASRNPLTAEGFSIYVGGDGTLSVNIRAANSPGSPPSFFSAPNVIQFGQFQHVAVTYDGSGTLAVLVNGINISLSGGMTLSGALQPSDNHFIGRRQDAATVEGILGASYFKGSIDELSIYSRALSTAEIQTIVNAGISGKCVSACAVPPVGGVSWWRGENNAADSFGTNGGTLQNGATFADGQVGRAFNFTDENQRVEIPDSNSLDLTNAVTLEAWVAPSQIGNPNNGTTIMHKGDLSSFGNQPYSLHYNSGGFVVFRVGNSSTFSVLTGSTTVLPLNIFTHIVGTYDGITSKIYINGVLERSSVENIGAMVTNNLPLRIGNNGFTGFVGKIDEPTVYSRALSAGEVVALFNAGGAGKCLTASPLQIAPTTANVLTGAAQTFTATGGTAPYAFSILTNNSGASINASSGIYTAGTIANVSDTVRVTDANNATANAVVTVAAACAANQKTWDGGGGTNNWSEAANWTCNAVPAAGDAVIFNGTSTKNAAIDINVTVAAFQINTGYTGTISQSASNLTVNGAFTQQTGTFGGGSGAIIFNSTFEQTGGTFSGGSQTNTFGTVATLSGGIFTATSGDTRITGGFGTDFTKSGGTFNHNGGTFIFDGGPRSLNINGSPMTFHNFTKQGGGFLNVVGTSGLAIVGGATNLSAGSFNSGGTLRAEGDVNISNTFGGGSVELLIAGTATRTITIPAGATLPTLTVNAANATVNTSGTGTINFGANSPFKLQNAAAFNTGSVNFVFGSTAAMADDLTASSGNLTFNREFTQTGGTFTGGGGTTTFSFTMTISGGIFNAASGNTIINGPTGTDFTKTGGTFNANGGTFTIDGGDRSLVFDNAPTTFHNFTKTGGGYINIIGSNATAIVTGTMNLSAGFLNVGGTIEAQGDVNISNAFTIGQNVNFRFGGVNNQTYINNGGGNPGGTWSINKPNGIVTAATSLILGATQPLNITSGTLYLNNNSNLTAGAITVGANGKLVSESAATITLGGNLINGGTIDLQGGGAACPETDTILIRSSGAAQRSWTGGGRYRLVDVDVRDMGGAGTKTVSSGTNTGGNNASWIFDANCPATLSITPSTANAPTGGTINFTAAGGVAPYVFSILTNNSGAAINPMTGVYTAGAAANVADTVRVTDAFGTTADAVVSVSGAASRLAFTVQPTSAAAGQAIAPAVQVAIQDANGGTIIGSTAAVTLAFAANPSNGTLSGTLTRNAVGGIAVFNDLSITRAGGGYTLQAGSGGLTSPASVVFGITPSVATQIAFVTQPSDTLGNSSIAPAPRVALQDQFGNTLAGAFGFVVTMTIGSNPGSGTLSGQTTANFASGVATFSNLTINNAGNGYTLVASFGSVPAATSAPFNIPNQFEVTNTNDAGAGSLRQAILNANSTTGTQTITFNIAGAAPFTIRPTFGLPPVSDRAIIDGTTQPGFSGAPVIEIDGSLIRRTGSAVSVLNINAGFSVVKGLIINNCNIGIRTNAIFVEIKGSYIGTDATGMIAKPNEVGISISEGNAFIGGANAADRNVISGNSFAGVRRDAFEYPVVSKVDNNYIGTKADGVSPLGNDTGVLVIGRRVFVGNDAPNIIAFNRLSGVQINSYGIPNIYGEAGIQRNSIHSNGGRAIKIGGSGSPVTVNDSLDTDAGDNLLQNYPVITSVTSANGATVIRGMLNSEPSKSYNIEFFANQVCDSSGYGEGENYIGFVVTSTDASGIASFVKTINAPVAVGSQITATATVTPGITSEFFRCQTVAGSAHSISGQIVGTNNAPLANVVIRMQGTSITTLTDSNGGYSFRNLPGGFNYTIVPTLPSAVFAPANRVVGNLSADQTNQNFGGTRQSRISGQITSSSDGATSALSGVTVTLSGANSAATQTDAFGNYVFNSVPNGIYEVTPSKAGFAFLPSSTSMNVNSDRTAHFSSVMTAGLSGRILGSYVSNVAMNADGSNEVYLLNGIDGPNSGCIRFPCQIALDAKLSKDGGKIAYIEATRDSSGRFTNGKIYVVNFDGSNRQLVYTFADHPLLFGNSLSWSPDGARLAFTVAQSSLHAINTDGTNQTTIIPTGAFGSMHDPDWSPDGTKILFGNRAISVVNINGTNRTQLTSGSIDGGARWSPNGSKIVFIRQPALNPQSGKIFTMNADGSAQTAITADSDFVNPLWSPDGAKLAFVKHFGNRLTENLYGVVNPNGSNLQIIRAVAGGIASWSPIFAPVTPAGTNVQTTVGAANITFSNVSTAGTTTITPISSAGTPPNGFVVQGGGSYEITTTAAVTPPITVCFTLPTNTPESRFSRLSVFHSENGILVDRTASRDFPTRRICAITNSLSPFAIAEQINPALPRISGLVRDANGSPLINAQIYLSGAENQTTTTDSSGLFSFVNLTAGANYNVMPKQIGYLFSEYNQDFVNLTDEQTVVFEGAASNFQISGRITNGSGDGIGNVSVNLDGAAQSATTTDAGGNYVFTNLPADGFYTLTPSSNSNSFSPNQTAVNALTSNAGGVDFQTFAPTAANVSVSGRVILPFDLSLQNAIVTLTDARGSSRTTLTGKFGRFRFVNVAAGEIYIVSVSAKRGTFAPQVVSITEDVTDLIFTTESPTK